ncbi:hypothetical protein DL93DRAFT_680271 [Clavulina sp. PMI_390]|nr:hypothetical protein DL93DRAFT_680271 [Clavulina sp. PMI_390]
MMSLNLRSMHRRLPPELLLGVFELLVGSTSIPEVHHTLLAITSVCSYWRSLAISSPSLWTRVYYGPLKSLVSQRSARKISKRARVFLERSRSLPIEILAENTLFPSIAPLVPTIRDQRLWIAIRPFISQLSRCRELTLNCTYVDSRSLWERLSKANLGLLESLSFKDRYNHPMTDTGVPSPVFEDETSDDRLTCKSLKTLVFWHSTPIKFNPFPIAPSLCHLEVVFCVPTWWDALVNALREFPFLQHLCVISVWGSLPSSWDETTRIELSHLASLNTNFPQFSVNLRTPRLSQLKLHGLEEWDDVLHSEPCLEKRWPHPSLDPEMSGIHNLSKLTLSHCELEYKNRTRDVTGALVLQHMMASLHNVAINTVEFLCCDGIYGILHELSRSPISDMEEHRSHPHALGSWPWDSEANDATNELLPLLRELVIVPKPRKEPPANVEKGGELEEFRHQEWERRQVDNAVARLAQYRPTLKVIYDNQND